MINAAKPTTQVFHDQVVGRTNHTRSSNEAKTKKTTDRRRRRRRRRRTHAPNPKWAVKFGLQSPP